MKTLYKNTSLIAAAIVATLVFSAGAAVALTRDAGCQEPQVERIQQVESVGRFVVTPNTVKFVPRTEVVASPAIMGRFVVSQKGAIYVQATNGTPA